MRHLHAPPAVGIDISPPFVDTDTLKGKDVPVVTKTRNWRTIAFIAIPAGLAVLALVFYLSDASVSKFSPGASAAGPMRAHIVDETVPRKKPALKKRQMYQPPTTVPTAVTPALGVDDAPREIEDKERPLAAATPSTSRLPLKRRPKTATKPHPATRRLGTPTGVGRDVGLSESASLPTEPTAQRPSPVLADAFSLPADSTDSGSGAGTGEPRAQPQTEPATGAPPPGTWGRGGDCQPHLLLLFLHVHSLAVASASIRHHIGPGPA